MKLWKLATLLTIGLAVASTAVACSDDNNDDDSSDSTPSASATAGGGDSEGPQTLQIQVDGDGEDYDAFMIAYFPREVTAHPGDTLEFKLEDSGEPHTVTGGAPVQAVVDFVLDYCGPEGFEAEKCQADPPPDVQAQFDELFGKLPSLLPEGPGDANQTAANPCFLATGEVPADAACPEVDPQPAFDGTESLYSSGWMSSDEDFVVELAPDLAPGTYTFLCLLHGPEMTETVTVVDAASDADTPETVDARREEQLGEIQDALAQPAADLAAFAGSTDPVPHDIQVGAEAEAPAGVAEFGPTDFTVAVGGTVTWGDLGGGHTVSFNAPESARSLRVVSDDGTVHINEEAASPAGVTPAEPVGDPEDPATPPTITDGGSWDGEGFLSTGAMSGLFKLTFTTAGTYEYKCLIHIGMDGTITVE